jgi:PPOX class probable FMN-dependent enzyme
VREIRTPEELRSLLGEPSPLTRMKFHRRLNATAAAFIGRSPLAFFSTADPHGRPTVSPKGDEPGFARVEGPTTLLVPERKGNRLLMTLQNLLADDRIGLLFVVPRTVETLRVHGTARIVVDEDLCRRFAARGRPALLVLRVEVQECFFHCGKALIRSGLWDPTVWPEPVAVSFGEEIAENARPADRAEFVTGLDCQVQERYRTDL